MKQILRRHDMMPNSCCRLGRSWNAPPSMLVMALFPRDLIKTETQPKLNPHCKEELTAQTTASAQRTTPLLCVQACCCCTCCKYSNEISWDSDCETNSDVRLASPANRPAGNAVSLLWSISLHALLDMHHLPHCDVHTCLPVLAWAGKGPQAA